MDTKPEAWQQKRAMIQYAISARRLDSGREVRHFTITYLVGDAVVTVSPAGESPTVGL